VDLPTLDSSSSLFFDFSFINEKLHALEECLNEVRIVLRSEGAELNGGGVVKLGHRIQPTREAVAACRSKVKGKDRVSF
jgi:hypothetical protein